MPATPVAVLLVAHGSRRAEANHEVRGLADQLGETMPDLIVRSAFLELADPDIPTGIRECASAGARRVVVLPYFLTSGRHVTEDLPRLAAEAAAGLEHVVVEQAPALGQSPQILQFLVDMVMAATA